MTFAEDIVEHADYLAKKVEELRGQLLGVRRAFGNDDVGLGLCVALQGTMMLVNTEMGQMKAKVRAAVATKAFVMRVEVGTDTSPRPSPQSGEGEGGGLTAAATEAIMDAPLPYVVPMLPEALRRGPAEAGAPNGEGFLAAGGEV